MFAARYDYYNAASSAAIPSGQTVNDLIQFSVLQTDSATQMQGKLASQVVADVAAKYPGAVCNKVVGAAFFVL
jgi:hypothetical protein